MTPIFTDTFFCLALLIQNDHAHARAVAASKSRRGRFVTTVWVLTEVGDALGTPAHHQSFTSTPSGSQSEAARRPWQYNE
jgi:hypothetical protein